jgi:hypothetical protein
MLLRPFSDAVPSAAKQIEVRVARSKPKAVEIVYVVTGNIAGLRTAPVASPDCTDELWRTTCFEAFIRAPESDRYLEFNFAPSTQWAAYGFDAYRAWVRNAKEAGVPRIDVSCDDARFELRAELDLRNVIELPDDAAWTLALSAVIEDKSGTKSFWALAHPPGKPDFHHADCFALTLPPP